MKASPGGYIKPSEVIGRDAFTQRSWRILERQSLVISAERRLGKTCILRKMQAEAPQDKLPLGIENREGMWSPLDLEGVGTPLGFAEKIFFNVEDYLLVD